MTQLGKAIVALFVLTVLGCSSDPAPPPPPKIRMLAATAPDPLCQLNGTNIFWIANGTTTTACPVACPDGTVLQCTAVNEEEVQCQNGVVVALGPTKPGEVISTIGSCPVPTQDCGANKNGSTWWTNTSTAPSVCGTCPDGSPHNCIVNVQTQYQCNNGVTSPTGQTQNGDIVQYTNECVPVNQSCGSQASGSTWWQITGTQQAACQTCWDGSQITCTYNTESQESCNNGTTSATGQTRQGALISQNGQCPAQPPKNCGNYVNGSTWWQDTNQTAAAVCETCPDGSPHNCLVTVQAQYICNNGTTSTTGQTQNGAIVQYTNTCPPVNVACGAHPNGTSWWQVTGQENANCGNCWDGSPIICNYQDEAEEMCNNGTIAATGNTKKDLIGQVNQCPVQPKDCGDVKDGATTWVANGQTAPYACEVCPDGTPHLCISENDVEEKCTDGTLAATGQSKAGPIVGYANTCPNVKQANESYTVPAALPKADVLFVLNTTPVMFKTIKELGEKFEKLISSWSNLDWQIGLSNADLTPWHTGYRVTPGDLIALNPFPNDSINGPLTILNNAVRDRATIFRQNIDFAGMDWPGDEFCEHQPYCSIGPAEPLKDIRMHIKNRDDAANHGFFRPGSTFVPIIVSAQDERRDGCDNNDAATKPDDVINDFNKNMGFMAGMKAYSIIIRPGDKQCLQEYSSIFDEGYGGRYGKALDQFANKTGGYSISICDKNYSKSLADLSQAVRQQVSSVTLAQTPYKGQVNITFKPSIAGISWSVQGNQVVFNQPLPPGTQLAISYLVLQP